MQASQETPPQHRATVHESPPYTILSILLWLYTYPQFILWRKKMKT